MTRTSAIALLAALGFSLTYIGVRAADPKPNPPTTSPAPVVIVQADGSLLLRADGARILGYKMHLDPRPIPTIIYWVDPKESLEWPKAVSKKGKYDVELVYSSPAGAGGEFIIAAGGNTVKGKTEQTKDWQDYKTAKLGTLTVINNTTSIALRSTGSFAHALMNVRTIKLTPVPDDEGKAKK